MIRFNKILFTALPRIFLSKAGIFSNCKCMAVKNKKNYKYSMLSLFGFM